MGKIDYQELQLAISGTKNKKLKVEYVHGYLTAVVCAPDLIKPSEWLSLVLGEDGDMGDFQSMEEANRFLGLIMGLYNEIAASTLDETFQPLYSIKDGLVTPSTAKTWCKGFILGLNLWRESFISDETMRALILPVVLISDKKMVIEALSDGKIEFSDKSVEKAQREAINLIPGNMGKLRHYNQKSPIPVKNNVKTGRNEPCPCGSGKKYKKCCGQ